MKECIIEFIAGYIVVMALAIPIYLFIQYVHNRIVAEQNKMTLSIGQFLLYGIFIHSIFEWMDW